MGTPLFFMFLTHTYIAYAFNIHNMSQT